MKILKFGENPEIWSKSWNLVKILKLGENPEIWWKSWNLVNMLKFGQNPDIQSKYWNLVEILTFGQNPEIWSKSWNLATRRSHIAIGHWWHILSILISFRFAAVPLGSLLIIAAWSLVYNWKPAIGNSLKENIRPLRAETIL